MLYTHTRPTEEGYYFKRHNDGVKPPTEKVVYVGRTDQGWRVQSAGPKQGYVEYGTGLALFSVEHTEWAGPIPAPEN